MRETGALCLFVKLAVIRWQLWPTPRTMRPMPRKRDLQRHFYNMSITVLANRLLASRGACKPTAAHT